MDWKQYLQENYFNPSFPGSFSGPKKLHQILKKDGRFSVGYHKLKHWLQNQDAYSLHQPVRYKFKRNRVVTKGIDDLWDMDLADVTNLSKHNNGIKFLLIVIDDFSKHLWVEPIFDRTHTSVETALENIFKRTNRRPVNIRSDKGSEFKNRWVKNFFTKNNINFYTTKNETKANYAERVIRTLKTMIYRYFSQNETYEYKDKLQDFVNNYNNSPHRTLGGLTPNDISKANEAKLWKQMYIDSIKEQKPKIKPKVETLKPKPYKFKKNDFVRISHLKYPFQRDYQQKWTEEIFKIKSRFRREGIPIYSLSDYDGDPIEGNFYQAELQKVAKDINDTFKIEKVIKKRKRNGITELNVKWRGWPSKFNSWIRESDIKHT